MGVKIHLPTYYCHKRNYGCRKDLSSDVDLVDKEFSIAEMEPQMLMSLEEQQLFDCSGKDIVTIIAIQLTVLGGQNHGANHIS